ncbi:hypothetical protein [Marinobacterium aestuariivivens]|uniref:Uncharacterized protein n=1 Tax=Marinobacterium aestuariivivens TaxID=1698799 RepID=A0ABW2A9T6_9GAMM
MQHAKRGGEVAREHHFPLLAHRSKPIQGWALKVRGAPKQGLDKIRKGMDEAAGIGSRLFETYHIALLAEAQMGCDQMPAARNSLQNALARTAEKQF